MLEIEYTVEMDSKKSSKDMGTNVGSRYYEPTKINAIVTVAKNQVTNECGKKAAVTQKFKINFVAKKESTVLDKNGKIQKVEEVI